MTQIAVGTEVKVQCYGGEILSRRVAKDCGKTVVVCNEAEYVNAMKEGRNPDGVGFPRDAVMPYNVVLSGDLRAAVLDGVLRAAGL